MAQVSDTLLIIAALLAIGALIAPPMVRLNVWIYHKLGMHNAASFCESKLHWWIPTVRGACGFAAIIVLAFALNLL